MEIGDDIIDTRDFDEMIEDLERELETFGEGLYPLFLHQDEDEDTLRDRFGEDFDEIDEIVVQLSDLNDFRNELENYVPDWKYGEALIHEDYRTTWTEEFARDIGALGENSDWIKIDWDATAEELFRFDYTSASIGGETYYVRAS